MSAMKWFSKLLCHFGMHAVKNCEVLDYYRDGRSHVRCICGIEFIISADGNVVEQE